MGKAVDAVSGRLQTALMQAKETFETVAGKLNDTIHTKGIVSTEPSFISGGSRVHINATVSNATEEAAAAAAVSGSESTSEDCPEDQDVLTFHCKVSPRNGTIIWGLFSAAILFCCCCIVGR